MLHFIMFFTVCQSMHFGVTSHVYSEKCPIQIMRGSGKFCQRGSKFDNVFFSDEGREDQIPL